MRSGSGQRLLLGLEFPQPSLNVREQIRLVAVRTSQWGYPSWQGGEGLGIEIDTSFHHCAGDPPLTHDVSSKLSR